MRQERAGLPGGGARAGRARGRGAARRGPAGARGRRQARGAPARDGAGRRVLHADSLWEPGGEKARAYLEQRGVDPEVARRFGLGYAPESWNALLGAHGRGRAIGDDVLVQAGLVLAAPERARLLRPLPRPAALPHPRSPGPRGGLRRPRARRARSPSTSTRRRPRSTSRARCSTPSTWPASAMRERAAPSSSRATSTA